MKTPGVYLNILFLTFQNFFQFVDLFFRRGPTGDKATDGMVLVGLSEVREQHLTTQSVYLFIVDDDKLLVGGGVDVELITVPDEDILHPHGHPDGMR